MKERKRAPSGKNVLFIPKRAVALHEGEFLSLKERKLLQRKVFFSFLRGYYLFER